MIGPAKFSVVGFEGSGAILGSLFLNGDKLPSENKKLVSRGLVVQESVVEEENLLRHPQILFYLTFEEVFEEVHLEN